MHKKIIFFDIDGTLLNGEGIVPDSARIALEKLKENGHLRFICTGRTKCMMPQPIKDLDFDGFVFGGGTMVEYKGKSLEYQKLSIPMIERGLEVLEKWGALYVFEGRDHLYIEDGFLEKSEGRFVDFVKQFGKHVKVFTDYHEVEASKFTLRCSNLDTVKKAEEFTAELEDMFEVIIHSLNDNGILTDGLVELLPKGYTKGTGILKTIEELGIPIEDTIGVGDSNNDLQMLRTVNTAVCMGNGTDSAKALADLITSGINDDGIFKAMKDLELI